MDVRDLAQRLVHADALQFGLLQCRGVVRAQAHLDARQCYATFVFKTVVGFSLPQSLRAILLTGEPNHSLSDRLNIAKDLAKSVSFVHTFGFVQKNIRPENILISTDSPSSLGHSYLVGFEAFRSADGDTLLRGDNKWERNIYRHPHRQGLRPNEYYVMQHDIYSLGVCLLEIGLWESFVSYEETVSPLPTAALGITADSLEFKEPVPIKEHLVALAKRDLPKRMGERYEEIVVNCLTCLDEDNADFGDQTEFEDPDGILVGVKYIRKVCHPCSASTRLMLTNTSRYY